jgi:hypothetical protein
MKRIIRLSLLFLANIVVLAHVVVPHHHHGRVIVSICNIFSIDDVLNHKHEDCLLECDEYEHSECFLNEDCILNELYTRSNVSSANSNDSDLTNFYIDFHIICHDIIPIIRIQDYNELPFRQKPYINSCYSHYITHSLGLRAPPAC